MDRGSERDTPPGRDDGSAAAGRIPLAVVVVDRDGRVSHWSSGARRLFGASREDAVGRAAADLLPVSGALPEDPHGDPMPDAYEVYDGLGPDLEASLGGRTAYATAGRARLVPHGRESDGERLDVLWWAYPLVGPGPSRLLVLAADATRLRDERGYDDETAERISPGFARHTELPASDELERRLPEILPNMGPGPSGRIVSQVLELGYPVLEFSQFDRVPVTPYWGVPRRPGRRPAEPVVPQQRSAPPLVPVGAEQDLEYAAVRERLEFLNEVSSGIGSSLDLGATIREVTSAAVPRFTDFAGTHLRAAVLAGEGFPDGPPDASTVMFRVWVEHNDEPGRWDDTVPVGEAFAFPEHTPFYKCMVTGEPVLIPRVTEELSERISGEFEKRDLRPLIGGRSLLIVPLKARNVVLGFMVLMRRPDRPAFDDMDRTTGAELAARAGLVLDNARMYTFQENVADTLQDSMLPQVTPRMAGCDIATRYLPGTRLGRIGGDWFDSVKLPGSRTALVVGDVMGHGLNSAAMMGQLRTAVQTMATMETPPAQLLRNLDDLARRLGDTYLATCLYAVYDPIRGELHLANAGHIPPVLVRAEDGSSELLELPTGAPIGVGGVPFETTRIKVAPGDRLVLCTDGLVEVRGSDIGEGLAALCESAAHPAASMDDACDTIIRALNTHGGRKDDVALLMARLNGIPDDHVAEWRLDAGPHEVARARRLVRERLLQWGLPQAVETAELLVSEVVTNAVRHAVSEPVGLRVVRTDALLFEVTDDEPGLPAMLSAGPYDESGRGLRVVSRLAREWGASATGHRKTVWFEQAITGRG
ncbi:ATP-binding SpoIIE family protein phosphatase [Streptomyces roseochromogenus]|uniref:Magnesium or manganese-dependent protein phosphatase n=1 Tax=Streptomyces roseochromogenus subsp. oscitans DS 12.976 TaxID=1352936 RepID=V6L190_STRRC|nr:SpoIIE family protein phosphatase [Streptomyces roseochromogenus]EST34999.1 magnesium or manganese-dependent protein phosphatase [Streptomyces roseochromogenus subsp. oscitans DS 12.976]